MVIIHLFILSKEAILEDSKNTTKDNGRKYDEDESRRHNDVCILEHFLVNLENQTESNGASDHACEPNEDLLFEIELAIKFANFQEYQQAYNCNESANHDDKNLKAD